MEEKRISVLPGRWRLPPTCASPSSVSARTISDHEQQPKMGAQDSVRFAAYNEETGGSKVKSVDDERNSTRIKRMAADQIIRGHPLYPRHPRTILDDGLAACQKCTIC
jgi:hypothetical protein